MAHPSLDDVRQLGDWRPPLGVVSVYLRFDPADRGGAWRTELRSGVDRLLDLAKGDDEHERKVAVRETAKRLLGRFDDEAVRPPPRGEVGFLEVSARPGRDRWWGTGADPVLPAVVLDERPVLTELVDLCRRCGACGVALLSAERVRLLRFAAGDLEELDEWELTINSPEWHEQDRDDYAERLEHSRHRFLVECGGRTGERLRERGLGEVLAFGPKPDAEAFWKGLGSTPIRAGLGGEADLISVPTGDLVAAVTAAVERVWADRDRDLVVRALGEAHGGSRGAAGPQETAAALAERRVEHLAFDPLIGNRAEELVRAALAGDAGITIARDGVAELLEPAEGVAALLRY